MRAKTVSYQWHLRRLMAEAGMFATTDMGPRLAARGITLSREQVYRLVTGVPERLSLPVLAALCDILDCGPGDLIEPVRNGPQAGARAAAAAPAGAGTGHPRAWRTVTARCPGGHELPGGTRQGPACPQCRRDMLIRHVIAVDGTLPASTAAAAVDAVAATPAALRSLVSALAADPDMLRHGAPPLAGRLAAELIARGSVLVVHACARCGRDGRPLFRTGGGGMCKACTARVRTAACAHCGEVKAIAGLDASGGQICERCRRRSRGHRACGHCGREAPVAVRARDGAPDTCVNCYRLPSAVCSGCGRNRPCNFAAAAARLPVVLAEGDLSLCPLRAGPSPARWPEGPVCDTCYTAGLRRRARCAGCGQERFPPGRLTCADCAGLPVMSASPAAAPRTSSTTRDCAAGAACAGAPPCSCRAGTGTCPRR